MAFLTANGLRFNVVRLGPAEDGPAFRNGRRPTPVVFVHGLILDNLSSYYYTLAPAVARRTNAVLYDLRGHGRTERPLSGYKIEDGAADLLAILDELGIDEPVHLIGNSFGGTVVLATAVLAPERVAGVVLIEGHAAYEGWGTEIADDLQDLVSGFSEPDMKAYLANGAPRRLKRMVSTCSELMLRGSLDNDFRTSRGTTFEDLAKVQCPTLLLYGGSSDLIDLGYVLDRTMPCTDLRIFDGTSHAVLLEQPEEVERQILDWLEQHGVPSADEPAAPSPVPATAGAGVDW
jgi:pimeloyl-ACP methyl ester carboxylesterase